MLKLLINSKLRHLLRSLSVNRLPAEAFCLSDDQLIMNFFAYTFHLLNPSPELLLQALLDTSDIGMGLLLQHMAPAAYLASLRNMLSVFAVRNSDVVDLHGILSIWSVDHNVGQASSSH